MPNLQTPKLRTVAAAAGRKPTHCVTKIDLRAFLKMTDTR